MYDNFNLEISSVCDFNCKFCNYQKLKRPKKFMSIATAKNVLGRMKKINANPLSFNLTGLGEPLLNTEFFDIAKLIKHYFPHTKLYVNTNCYTLDKHMIHKIIKSPLDIVCCSIRFCDNKKFNKYCGKDCYYSISENVKLFLALKGNNAPNVHLQVFGNQNVLKFYLQWFWRLNKNDSIVIQKCLNLKPDSKLLDRLINQQIGKELFVDVDGDFYNGCISIWGNSPERFRIKE